MSLLDNVEISSDAETIIEHIESKLQVYRMNLNSKVSNKSMEQYNQIAIDVLNILLLDIQMNLE